jgi:hypothetical protein
VHTALLVVIAFTVGVVIWSLGRAGLGDWSTVLASGVIVLAGVALAWLVTVKSIR